MATPSGEAWEQLTTANDDIDAQLLVGVLEEADIPTRVVKNRSGYGDYLFGGSNPWAPVAVHVQSTRLLDARTAIEALPAAASEEPSSSAAPMTSRTATGWTGWIAVGIVALIVLAFLLEQRELIL